MNLSLIFGILACVLCVACAVLFIFKVILDGKPLYSILTIISLIAGGVVIVTLFLIKETPVDDFIKQNTSDVQLVEEEVQE